MDNLADLTVVELRNRLRDRSLPTAGKKAELIKRLSVMPQSLPLVEDEEESALPDADEVPVSKTSRKSKKTKSQPVNEEEPAANSEDAEEEVPTQKKARKSSKKTSSKKSKKSKVVEPLEEEEETEEAGLPKDDTDDLNTSSQTYDVVSPKAEPAKEEEEKEEKAEVKTANGRTPIRRPSECRRSIFKRLGLDPAHFTPTSGAKKRESSSAGQSTPAAKRRKSTVEEKKVEVTVSIDKEEEEEGQEQMEVEEEQVAPDSIPEEDEEEGVEDEEQEEREEAQPAEFWSDDDAAANDKVAAEADKALEVDQSMMSEASSVRSTRSRRSARNSLQQQPVNTPLATSATRATTASASAAKVPGSATRPTPTRPVAASSSAANAAGQPPRPRSVGRLPPGARFGAAHAKLFAAQEFIGDTMAKKEERKAALLKTTGNMQRLATPKNAAEIRQPLRDQQTTGFKFGSSALPKTFRFGATAVDEIQTVQKRPSAIPAPSASLIARKKVGEEKKLDVKGRAKQQTVKKPVTPVVMTKNPLLLPTIPDDCSFVERMATPRAQLSSAARAHRRGAGGYSPKKGKVDHFVDTTKLSDREYQIALEAGLLPGMNKKKTSTMKEKERKEEEERRNRARDELFNVKRKLKIA